MNLRYRNLIGLGQCFAPLFTSPRRRANLVRVPPTSPDVDVVVIGAGVVGIAVGRALARRGREVAILEAADDVATQTSSHNSEVIHSGIYYPTGSLKARACVDGRRRLYRYCADRGVAHRKVGKIVVASSDAQVGVLESIRRQARDNGVHDLRPLRAADVAALEPDVDAVAGLLSPSTGIVDSSGFVRALLADALDDGVALVLRARVVAVVGTAARFRVTTTSETLTSAAVVNCAGLNAWQVAASIDGLATRHIPPRYLAKGNYFGLRSGSTPFRHLIYPVPVDGGLGVHLTLDLDGVARFGPDVEWLAGDDYDYHVDPARAAVFYREIRRYWPGLPDDALVGSMAGIRPKCSGPGQPAADFLVQDCTVHGIDGLVNLFGIESPGLTSSLALADHVARRLA